ncbi:MAG: FKBP-type peptidyl-prolyl cis-trans isomerase [Parafilimonas sp.]
MSLQDKLKAMFETKAEDQEKFLQDNATKEGVITLPSGLQYLILQNGDGDKPGVKTMVTVHYEGSLVNGKIFDSSYKRGQPATFGVHQVIPGWTEALQMMPVGSKWKLFIPSSLGYGARGAGGSIPPNATLIFDVELLSMK